MKRTMLLFALFVVSAANASAAQWKYVGSDGKSTHCFYKPKTYAMKNNTASSWTKIEYNVDLNAMAQKKTAPDEYVGRKSVVAYEEFQCAERKKRTLIGKVYEGRDESDLSRTDWAAVQPGSIDEALLAALCKGAERAPAKK